MVIYKIFKKNFFVLFVKFHYCQIRMKSMVCFYIKNIGKNMHSKSEFGKKGNIFISNHIQKHIWQKPKK